jgi:hypothetical protein
MSRSSGVFLIVAGVGLSAYALHWSVDTAATARRVAAQSAAAPAVEAAPEKAPVIVQVQAVPEAVSPPSSVKAASRPAVAAAVAVAPSAPATKTIAIQLPTAGPKALPMRSAVSAPPPLDRARVTKELLVQLKRVGCYQGPIGTVWTPVARRSMKAFTEHVNATLPVDQPDYILLAMVQSHEGQACGLHCPAGETRAQDGRCLPTAVIAANKRAISDPRVAAKTAPIAPKQLSGNAAPPVAAAAPFEPAPLPMGRMSLAGPKQESPPAPGKQQRAASEEPADPSEVQQPKTPRQQRQSGKSAEPKRAKASASRFPSWVPWSQSWVMN